MQQVFFSTKKANLFFPYLKKIIKHLYYKNNKGRIIKMKKWLVCNALAITSLVCSAEPILKVGIISDTHIKKRESSCNILTEAMKLFKQHNVQVIINAGDIADVHIDQAYINYRNTVKKVYGNTPDVQEIFAFAWHERIKREREPQEKVFADVKKHLEIKHEMYDKFKIKGYTFLVFPQDMNFKRYEQTIADAIKENPDKPLFVIDHVPPFNTVYNSKTWGEPNRRKILDKYPQVIHISGHVHGTLTNELNIWQGNFTSVNAGSLYSWAGSLVGNSPAGMLSDMSMIMEIYPDKLVFRRFFSMSKKEYQPTTPWVVPLPFNAQKAPYNTAYRRETSIAPEFAADAKLKTEITQKGVVLKFPQALHKDGVFNYKIMLYVKNDGKWHNFSRKDIMGNFMHDGAKRTRAVRELLSFGYFDLGKTYRIEVIPVHFFGKEGKAAAAEFTLTDRPASTVVFETSDPMKDCQYFTGIDAGKKIQAGADGFYDNKFDNARLVFPANVWDGKKGTKFRFTADICMQQFNERTWTLVLRNPKPLTNANARIATPYGNTTQRFVIDFAKQGDLFNYSLLVREGGRGKIRFNYIKIERLD